MSPMRPASGARDRPAARRPGRGSASAASAPSRIARRAGERRHGQQPDVGERVIDPRGRRAPRRRRRPRRRSRSAARTASSVSDSSLSGGDRSTGTPGRLERGDPGLEPSESPSPTQRSIATPSGPASRAPPSAATTRPIAASQPGHAASSSSRARAVAVGQDQRLHPRDATPPGPGRRGPMLDSGRARRPRSIPRSSASSTPPRARA